MHIGGPIRTWLHHVWSRLLTLLITLLAIGPITASETVVLVQPHGNVIAYDASEGAKVFPKGALTEQFVSNGLTFNISYEDAGVGFTDPDTGLVVRNRFEDVLAYVAETIRFPSGTLDIQVTPSEFDGTGALASAGTFYPATPGIHAGSTLSRLNSGIKPFAGFPEISVTVDVGFAWNISTGAPPPGTSDFFSVLLHEITHGLGFTSLIEPDGGSSVSVGVYSVYDSLLTDGSNGAPLLGGVFLPSFQANIASLTSDDVWFDGAQAFIRYELDTQVPVFAPGPFQPGSSISHWDQNVLQGGSVMTHAITLGTAQRKYTPVDLGALIDLGYNHIEGAPDVAAGGCTPNSAKSTNVRSAGSGVFLIVLLACALMATPGRFWRVVEESR